jgi:D-amino-acid oxidase
MTNVLVLGGGVVGLNTALRLALDTDYKVTVYSSSYLETTSSYAGAFWWPSPAELQGEQLPDWALESFEFLRFLKEDAGITQRKIVGLAEGTFSVPDWFTRIPGFREVNGSEIDPPFKHGVVIESAPVIDPPTHLKWLRDRLSSLGVTLETQTFKGLDDALTKCSIVLNCTGLGAQDLCGDSDLHPVSGQLVKLRKRDLDHVMFMANKTTRTAYIIPQSTCTILGGTYFDNDRQTEPDQNETRLIIERCNRLWPKLQASDADVIGATRALRPVRSRVRLEVEKKAKGVIVHNYGHGRSGFSLAYGAAGAALKLLAGL